MIGMVRGCYFERESRRESIFLFNELENKIFGNFLGGFIKFERIYMTFMFFIWFWVIVFIIDLLGC